ncbi:MAG TPA: single-stranded-DNA-specific exonuclease RecJ [Candidatus Limnocylindria bacterium]
MIGPRLEWQLPEPLLDPPGFTGFGRPISTLLARRGFRDDAQLVAFLDAGQDALHDVSLMADADVALSRLERALDLGERIAIWGDYDADGMTAVVVWSIALRALGAEAIRHVPSRLAEGYGLSNPGLERLAAAGVTLVVTCDCGVVNVAEVAYARSLGVDVIVTDHHLPAGDLPPAVAVVDPHRPDCAYPDPDLTGAGLAYKLATALLARRGAAAADLAAMASIGTVADLAPMTGESRAIVRLGLAEAAATRRAGLRTLLARSCESPEQVTGRDLAYNVAPRINAAGRIAEAELAIALLLEEDPTEAERLADELEAVHRQRRDLTSSAVAEARTMVEGLEGTGPIALRHDAWAPGIVGLIAGRLADTLERPVAVAAPAGDELRGSVRGPIDFHAAAALEACATHLAKRGGHAAAGGFSLAPDNWERFVETFQALPRPFPPSSAAVAPAGRIAIDLVLPAAHLGWELAGQIERLAPFGPGHVEPLLAVTGLRVGDARRVGPDGRHLALRMLRGAETFDAIGFGTPSERPLPEEGSLVDLVGTLERDTYQGEPRLRLRVVDFASSSLSPLAARREAARATALQPVPMASAAGATAG